MLPSLGTTLTIHVGCSRAKSVQLLQTLKFELCMSASLTASSRSRACGRSGSRHNFPHSAPHSGRPKQDANPALHGPAHANVLVLQERVSLGALCRLDGLISGGGLSHRIRENSATESYPSPSHEAVPTNVAVYGSGVSVSEPAVSCGFPQLPHLMVSYLLLLLPHRTQATLGWRREPR